MAAALQCEICGGKLVGKPGGVFECDSCGMEYSTEWAKQKIQEIKGTVKVEGTVEVTGKVQVEGGSVTLEGATTKESLLKRAKMCLEDADWEQVKALLEQVLNADPECGEAYLYRCMAKHGLWKETFVAAYCDVNCIKIAYDPDVKKAFRYASGETAAFLERCAQERERAIQADLKHRMEMRSILAQKRKIVKLAAGRIIRGVGHTVGLKTDGTVVAVGGDSNGQCDVSGWRNIVAVSAGSLHTVGLKSDGTVVAAGSQYHGQCNVSDWRDIVAVSAGDYHTVGLKSDCTVVAVGNNDYGRCNVSGWRDIAAVSAGDRHTVGLKSDGTVVAVGNNGHGQCAVSGWRDIAVPAAAIAQRKLRLEQANAVLQEKRQAHNDEVNARIAETEKALAAQKAIYAENANKVFGAGAKLKKAAKVEIARLEGEIANLRRSLK